MVQYPIIHGERQSQFVLVVFLGWEYKQGLKEGILFVGLVCVGWLVMVQHPGHHGQSKSRLSGWMTCILCLTRFLRLKEFRGRSCRNAFFTVLHWWFMDGGRIISDVCSTISSRIMKFSVMTGSGSGSTRIPWNTLAVPVPWHTNERAKTLKQIKTTQILPTPHLLMQFSLSVSLRYGSRSQRWLQEGKTLLDMSVCQYRSFTDRPRHANKDHQWFSLSRLFILMAWLRGTERNWEGYSIQALKVECFRSHLFPL